MFIPHQDLDLALWDRAVAVSPAGHPYAFSWYLDIVSNQKWDALVEGNYERVMPLVWNAKLLGIRQLYQPVLSQQLGVFGAEVTAEHTRSFLEAIPARYKYVQINVHGPLPAPPAEGQIRRRTNLVLPLQASYEELCAGYTKSLRKRVRSAGKQLRLQETGDAGRLVRFYRDNLEHKVGLGRRSYPVIERLIRELLRRDAGRMWEVKTSEGRTVCMGFFPVTSRRVINLFGASNETGRATYAMHFLIDAVIRQYAGREMIFDFEGSEIPGIAAFFRSFGSREEAYFEYQRDRLPGWLRMVRERRLSW